MYNVCFDGQVIGQTSDRVMAAQIAYPWSRMPAHERKRLPSGISRVQSIEAILERAHERVAGFNQREMSLAKAHAGT